jgi:hypothetical protein
MRYTYNQKNVTVLVDGVMVEGISGDDGAIEITYGGGEIEPTRGISGPAMNQASPQEGKTVIKLLENSPTRDYFRSLRKAQEAVGSSVTVLIRSGVDALHTIQNALISLPGPLSTGGPKQGLIAYTFIGSPIDVDNLALNI